MGLWKSSVQFSSLDCLKVYPVNYNVKAPWSVCSFLRGLPQFETMVATSGDVWSWWLDVAGDRSQKGCPGSEQGHLFTSLIPRIVTRPASTINYNHCLIYSIHPSFLTPGTHFQHRHGEAHKSVRDRERSVGTMFVSDRWWWIAWNTTLLDGRLLTIRDPLNMYSGRWPHNKNHL